jgi:hypothetical protein
VAIQPLTCEAALKTVLYVYIRVYNDSLTHWDAEIRYIMISLWGGTCSYNGALKVKSVRQ